MKIMYSKPCLLEQLKKKIKNLNLINTISSLIFKGKQQYIYTVDCLRGNHVTTLKFNKIIGIPNTVQVHSLTSIKKRGNTTLVYIN